MPDPKVVQVRPVALPPILPDKVCKLPAHIVAAGPAIENANLFMVTIMSSLTGRHGPTGSSLVMVSVTVPAAISAAEGVYIGDKDKVLLKVPVPEVDHTDDEALPLLIPVKATKYPWQITISGPALTIAGTSIVKIIFAEALVQGPPASGSVDVRVNKTLPES